MQSHQSSNHFMNRKKPQFQVQFSLSFYFIISQTTIQSSNKMGSIQSTIKACYRMQMAPMFKTEVNKSQYPQDYIDDNFILQHQNLTSQLSDLTREDDSVFQNNVPTKKLQIKLQKYISNSHYYPYSAVGLIKSTIDGQEINGSGTIIGKKHVLTCAHNCYSIKERKAIYCLHFFPSYSPSKSGPCYRAKTIYFSSSFKKSLQDDSSIENTITNDYAVIELDTDDNLQNEYGSLGIDFSEQLSSSEKEIIGYSKRSHHRHPHFHCYTGEGHLEHGLIKYDMPASKDMAGSPIVERRNGQYYIIGLHVYCLNSEHSQQKGGLKLGRRAFEDFQKWIMQIVETVDLKQKSIEKEGLKYICKHRWKKLRSLNLVKCNLEQNCAKYFKTGNWAHLTDLDLGGNSLGQQGMYEFSQADFPKLNNLSLWGNNIGKGGAYYLTLAKLDFLQQLNLYINQLGSQGLQTLCKGKWVRLVSLHLGNNSIRLKALANLYDTCWVNLEALSLWGNDLEYQEQIIKVQLQSQFKKFKSLLI